jgi:hypothetical protein
MTLNPGCLTRIPSSIPLNIHWHLTIDVDWGFSTSFVLYRTVS